MNKDNYTPRQEFLSDQTLDTIAPLEHEPEEVEKAQNAIDYLMNQYQLQQE